MRSASDRGRRSWAAETTLPATCSCGHGYQVASAVSRIRSLASGGADPNAMLGRLFMTFSGSYGFLAFAAICGGFYISGPLRGYIIRKPGAATLAETMNGVAQVLSGNPNGVMVLAAGFLQLHVGSRFCILRLQTLDGWDDRTVRCACALANI